MEEKIIIEGQGMLDIERTTYPENTFIFTTEGPDDRDTALLLKTVATSLAKDIKDKLGADPWDLVFYQENNDWAFASEFEGKYHDKMIFDIKGSTNGRLTKFKEPWWTKKLNNEKCMKDNNFI